MDSLQLISFLTFLSVCCCALQNTVLLISRQRLPKQEVAASNDPAVALCVSEGAWRHPMVCSEYVVCRAYDGRTVVMDHYKCAFGVFDPLTVQCNWPKLSLPCGESATDKARNEERFAQRRPVMTSVMPPKIKPDLVQAKKEHAPESQRPSSYTSELTGLNCKAAGYFPHPNNSTKFYRCVRLPTGSYLIYLFSCEGGLLYEPTVRACVKSLGEQRMETGVEFSLTNTADSRSWEIQRCSKGNETLFRNPVNCRRFFRCSSTSDLVKIEQFSCPTGLFFDQERRACTWASETSECLPLTDDLADVVLLAPRNPLSQAIKLAGTTAPPPPTGALATIWMTQRTTPVSTLAPVSFKLFVEPMTTTPPSVAWIAEPSAETQSERLFSGDDSNWLWKQTLKPPPYLTATGVLVTDNTEFPCLVPGTFPSENPCVFYKCEKYAWVKNFMLFRFRCPPHTAYFNGTCEYDPVADCSGPTSTAQKVTPTAPGPQRIKEPSRPIRPLLCLREGIFPVPYATQCNTRFMTCRRLTGPLHFFVSIHECPPSLIFSSERNKCLDPSFSKANCPEFSFDVGEADTDGEPSFYPSFSAQRHNSSLPVCRISGFTKIGCRQFRRCEWVVESSVSAIPKGTWVSYDFECGKRMVFDEDIVACVHPTRDDVCADETSTLAPLITQAEESTTTRQMLDFTSNIPLTSSDEEAVPPRFGDLGKTTGSTWTLPTSTETVGAGVTGEESSHVINDETNVEELAQVLLPNDTLLAPTQQSLDEKLVYLHPVVHASTTTGAPAKVGSRAPVCYSSGYFLYPGDARCQRFYRCLQLTPEPNSFVMLHYRCDDGFVFDQRYFACSAAASAPSCEQINASAASSVTIKPAAQSKPQDSASANAPVSGGSSGSLPIKILPQVWQTDGSDSSSSTGALICTTQQTYRLQTCGYYYSCTATGNGKFHLQELYCESLYLDIATGQCTTPPPNDPCNANALTRFSTIWAVRRPSPNPPTTSETFTDSTTDPITTTTTTSTPTTTAAAPTTTTTIPAPTEPTTSTIRRTTRSPPVPAITPGKRDQTIISTPRRISWLPPSFPAGVKVSGSASSSSSSVGASSLDISGAVFISASNFVDSKYVIGAKNRVAFGTLPPFLVPRRTLQTIRYVPPTAITVPITTTTETSTSTTSSTTTAETTSTTTGSPATEGGGVLDSLTVGPMEGAEPPSTEAMVGSVDVDSLTAYRENFNRLYAQLSNAEHGSTTTTLPSTQSALILNFNTISGQLTNLTTGVSFQCRSEGYFRNSRDVTCSKFYLCVKVGPQTYNLFEFMCLPHNGIQWKYNQERNACADPDDVVTGC